MITRVGTVIGLLIVSIGVANSAELTVPTKAHHYVSSLTPATKAGQDEAVKSVAVTAGSTQR